MKRLAILVVVAVALAGCTTVSPQDADDKPKKLEVTGPECTVNGQDCSSVQVRKYSDPKVTVEAANYGDSEIEIDLGTEGREVMVSGCNIYELKEGDGEDEEGVGFQAWKRSTAMKDPVTGSGRVVLEPDQRLQMEWNFELADIDISRLGTTCPLDFALTFNQSLNSSQTIQVKDDEDVPDASPLSFSTTGVWPVKLEIDSEKIVREGRPFVARAYLNNVGSGEVEDIGFSGGDHDIDLSFEGVKVEGGEKQQECSRKKVRMYGAGERSGESFREVCDFTPKDVSVSEVFDLEAETEYRYSMDLSGVEISVVPVEGRR